MGVPKVTTYSNKIIIIHKSSKYRYVQINHHYNFFLGNKKLLCSFMKEKHVCMSTYHMNQKRTIIGFFFFSLDKELYFRVETVLFQFYIITVHRSCFINAFRLIVCFFYLLETQCFFLTLLTIGLILF